MCGTREMYRFFYCHSSTCLEVSMLKFFWGRTFSCVILWLLPPLPILLLLCRAEGQSQCLIHIEQVVYLSYIPSSDKGHIVLEFHDFSILFHPHNLVTKQNWLKINYFSVDPLTQFILQPIISNLLLNPYT